MRFLRWLMPGLYLKRWLLLFTAGVFLIGVGISLVVQEALYARVERFISRQLLDTVQIFNVHPIAAAVTVLVMGTFLAYLGMYRLIRSVLETLVPPTGGKMAEAFYQRRSLLRGPKVVAIGGGTGIPTLLRGMKEYTANLTAVITVADDGGSSGRLRSEFGILPPGDIRNCLVALADTEPMMERLFQYRFQNGDGLAGHPFGNLFILAMTEATGNFYDAVQASSQVLAVRGRVMPATLAHVQLRAELADGRTVIGESAVGSSPVKIERVFLEQHAGTPITALPDALAAIEDADVLVMGPGSLYTSIIPNLLVPGVADAIRRSKALKVYVCNIMTQPGETDHYSAAAHVKALIDHAGYGIVDLCVVHAGPIPEHLLKRYAEQQSGPVTADVREIQRLGVRAVQADLLEHGTELVRHSPIQLATVISRLVLDHRNHLERTPWDYFLMLRRLQEISERLVRRRR